GRKGCGGGCGEWGAVRKFRGPTHRLERRKKPAGVGCLCAFVGDATACMRPGGVAQNGKPDLTTEVVKIGLAWSTRSVANREAQYRIISGGSTSFTANASCDCVAVRPVAL